MTFGCHYVTEQGQMSVVYVKTVEVQHEEDLFLHTFSDSFNAQNLENFTNVVTHSTGRVHISFGEYPHQGCSVSFQKPFSICLKLTYVE